MSFQNVKRVVSEIFHHNADFNPRDPVAVFSIIEALHEPLTADDRIRLMNAHAASFHDARGMYETATRPLTWDEYPFEDKVMMVAVVAYHTHYRYAPNAVRCMARDHFANYIAMIISEWLAYNHKIDPSRFNLPERCRSLRNFMAIMNITTIRMAKILYSYMANTCTMNELLTFGSRNVVIERITSEPAYNTMMLQVEYRMSMQMGINPNHIVRTVRQVMDELPASQYADILQLHLN